MAQANPIEIQKYLKGMNYPASQQDVVQHAQDNGADDDTIAVLEKLPDQQYETVADVSKEIGNIE